MPAAKSRSPKPASRKTASQKTSSKRPAKAKATAPTKKKASSAAAAKKSQGAAGKKKAAASAKGKAAGSKDNKKKKPPVAVGKKKPASTVSKKKPPAPTKVKASKAVAAPGKKKGAAPVKANAKASAKGVEKVVKALKAASPTKIDIKMAPAGEGAAPAKAQVKVKAEEKGAPTPKPPKLVVAKKEPAVAPSDDEVETDTEAAQGKPTAVKVKAPKPPKLAVVKTEEPEEAPAEESAAKPSLLGMPLSSTVEPPLEGGVLVPPAVAAEGMQLLVDRYPDAQCELNYANAFQLLIAVILSAQTTDANVNRVTPTLFKKFPTPKALAQADPDEVKGIIRSTGYFNSKAKSIQECARALADRFNSEVPDDIEKLVALPGVGRKTANVVLGVAFEKPGWTVDTHVQRLSRRLGYTLETDPEKIEMDLQKLFPESEWTKDSITLIWHGRRCCFARNPNCAECPVNKICPSSRVK